MSLLLPVLTLLWKMKLGDTFQKTLQRPPTPRALQMPPAPIRIPLQSPICWQAAHSMTTCSMCGNGTGLKVMLSMNHSKHNHWKALSIWKIFGIIILKQEVQPKYCMGMLYCPQFQGPHLIVICHKICNLQGMGVHRLYLKQSCFLPLLYTVIMRLIKIN